MKQVFKKIGLFVLITAVLGGLSAYIVYRIFYPGERGLSPKNTATKTRTIDDEEKFVAAGRTNIALLGVDARAANEATGEDPDNGRADTIIVATYDPEAEKITLFSIPRDLRVLITHSKWDKINHSYNYGGVGNVVAAIESLLGIRIDYYAKVNFQGFERMIDAAGGVSINIDKRMYYEDPWEGENGYIIDLAQGEQVLDGKQALQFVRYRDGEGDIGRVRRQQDFLKAVYAKISQPEMWLKLPEFAGIALDALDTDLDLATMLQLIRTLNKNSKSGLSGVAISGEPVYIDGINYLLPDIVGIRSQVSEALGVADGGLMQSGYRLAQLYEENLPDNIVHYGDEPEKTDEDNDAEPQNEEEEKIDDKDEIPVVEGEKEPDNSPEVRTPVNTAVKTQPAAKPNTRTKPVNKTVDKNAKQLRVAVINCSGNPDSGKKMETLLENSGVAVVSISDGTVQKDSAVVSTTYDSWVVNKLAALPFRYSLRLTKVNKPSVEATVYVGKDFI